MAELIYYIADSETSGLVSSHNEVTEIGIIRYSDKVQLWRNIKCEYPWRANVDALRITNKTLADLENGYDKNDVVSECNKFFAEDNATPAHRVIIAHNAPFDRRFLHALWEQCSQEFPAHLWLDTISLTREFAKKMGIVKPKVNLHAACDLVGIKKFAAAHNAKVDSRNTYLLYKDLIENKNIDHLPFIQSHIHSINKDSEEECGLDPDLLDI